MKRLLPLLCLLLAALPATAQCDLYQRYASQKDCLVAYQQRHAIDSTHHAAVLLLRAQTDQAWQWMQQEFGMRDGFFPSGPNLIHRRVTICRDRLDPRREAPMKGGLVDKANSCCCVFDIDDRTLCIYFPETAEGMDAIMMKQLRSIKK